MLKEMKKFGLLAALGLASVANAQNLLYNPGFEDRCQLVQGWDSFGNVFVDGAFTTDGNRTLKVFGPFCCPLGYSGFSQDVPTVPGDQWQASCMLSSPSWDALSWNPNPPVAGTHFFLELQFLDANKNIIHPYGQYRSPEQNSGTNGIPVPLSTPVYTAPAGAVYCRLAAIVEQGNWVGGAVFIDEMPMSHPGGPNVIQNGSFETNPPGCTGSALQYWVNFGNGGPNNDGNARTGGTAAKLWGAYSAPVANSGWFQDVPATAGSQWKFSAWGRTVAGGDLLAGGNDVFVSMEFIDANNVNISGWDTFGSPWRSSPMATGAANNLLYNRFETAVATAPEGTVKVRALMYQHQNNYAGGATWWDDAELVQIGGPTCYADYNQDGGVDGGDIESFFNDWESGSAAADVNQDGGVDGSDIETFFVQWENGGC